MNWFLSNWELVLELTLNHIRLSIIPIIVGFVIAVPLGRLAITGRAARGVIITSTSLLYTIPSLPLFVILPAILGTRVLSDINLIVALSIYAVAIMVRAASDSFASVSPDVKQASLAMGYSRWQQFWRVEFPLAGPVLLAGMRVVSVSTIALVSVGVLIGSENLGYLFTNGKQRGILEEVGTGIIASLLIALVFDVILVLLGRILLPWSRVEKKSGKQRASEAILVSMAPVPSGNTGQGL
ncbi:MULTISPECIES: ABC transporter permease [unclassified Leifsonia]|uniref:ABC transporter permease n=1 Tax=unclassified Leifsonia TaxID=2663824 RepID=UPI0006FE9B54|nr:MULTISPECIES: ABC transporter permease [unclassified Leifsonia]KQX07119.1 ABC transporter permease [Leifsonia sp. Root1293]KRA11402.1 ABC transporter permease [Leifsonia sp. Root60]